MKKYILNYTLIFILQISILYAQTNVPRSYSNLESNKKKTYIKNGKKKIKEANKFIVKLYNKGTNIGLSNIENAISATQTGFSFDFDNKNLNGTIYYGLIPRDTKYPQPILFKVNNKIKKGKSHINIYPNFTGKYDILKWEAKGKGSLGYRIIDEKGLILYDGKIDFNYDNINNKFEYAPTIIEGPFINRLETKKVMISFKTQKNISATILVNKKKYSEKIETKNHEILIYDLTPNTKYEYTIIYGNHSQKYSFKTPPQEGSRSEFTFAYASDSRKGPGGGERNIYGANAYIIKKLIYAAIEKEAAFFQFSGDMIDGYLTDIDQTNLQYSNWKHATEHYSHYFPMYISMGNHETVMKAYASNVLSKKKRKIVLIDNFPFETHSAEAVFANNFVMPENGPVSEDNTKYDSFPKRIDFPSYSENVYYYTYDNVAVIVLNSDYWYAPSLNREPATKIVGGNLHGYIMDNQLTWLENTIASFESNENIDHIFVSQHTPAFPNGGHSGDDMWYNGNNDPRPWINNKPVDFGIIERRDQYLDILVNKSKKVKAILTGDEHNYNKMYISEKTKRYPENYDKPKVKLSRPIYQINNGAAGAPYYSQEVLPWSEDVSGFSTQNALVLIKVKGKQLSVKVINPETFEELDKFEIE